IRRLSPFYYFDRTNALLPNGGLDLGGTIGLLVLALVLTGLAAAWFERRDLGASLLRGGRSRPAVFDPDPNPLLRVPVLPGLYEQRIGLAVWMIATAITAGFLVSIARQIVDTLQATQGM